MVHYHVEEKPLIREYVSKVGKEPASHPYKRCALSFKANPLQNTQESSHVLKHRASHQSSNDAEINKGNETIVLY